MRIYVSERSDPMVTGTLAELNELAENLQQFVASSETELLLTASTSQDPAPYDALLPALRITKREGPIMISLQSSGELSVSGSAENLDLWVSYFRFPSTAQDGDHHHPESVSRLNYVQTGSLSTIIEVEEARDDAL